jgi:hypothetical protein
MARPSATGTSSSGRPGERDPAGSCAAEAWMLLRSGIATLAVGVALTVGCSRATGAENEREMVYRAETALLIKVVNNSQLDATIYLVHDGARERLGAVTAASSASFTVQARTLATGEFRLVADPLGVRRTTSTEGLSASQGTTFIWTLEANLSRGSVLVQD